MNARHFYRVQHHSPIVEMNFDAHRGGLFRGYPFQSNARSINFVELFCLALGWVAQRRDPGTRRRRSNARGSIALHSPLRPNWRTSPLGCKPDVNVVVLQTKWTNCLWSVAFFLIDSQIGQSAGFRFQKKVKLVRFFFFPSFSLLLFFSFFTSETLWII